MPTALRIIILLVIYLIYLVSFFWSYYDSVEKLNKVRPKKVNSEKKQSEEINSKDKESKKAITKKELRLKYFFRFLLQNLFLFSFVFEGSKEHIAFSYFNMILASAYLFELILMHIIKVMPKEKKKEKQKTSLCRSFIKVTALILVLGVIALLTLSCSVTSETQWFLNPAEKTNYKTEEYKTVRPTINIWELEKDSYYNTYQTSIGYNPGKDVYFFYYRDYETGQICRFNLTREDISDLEESTSTSTYIIAEETTYDLIFTELKETSKYYKKEVTETKYKLYLNPKEIVTVNE